MEIKKEDYETENNNLNIKVFLKIRPPKKDYTYIESLSDDRKNIKIQKDFEYKEYNFENIFTPEDSNMKTFANVAVPIINSVIEGFNGSLIVYGQTGSGKTHSVLGLLNNNLEKNFGIVQFTISYLLSLKNDTNIDFEVSAIQIYKENIHDILDNDKKITFRMGLKGKNQMKLHNCKSIKIDNIDKFQEILINIKKNRIKEKTKMNDNSSRSHAIFMIEIYNKKEKRYSMLNIVDLAGNERIKKSNYENKIEESISINNSLMALSKCIYFIINDKGDKNCHIPYRESKLTRILQPSLTGNCKTNIIIAVSPDNEDVNESVNSMDFGVRASKIILKSKKEICISNKENLLSENIKSDYDTNKIVEEIKNYAFNETTNNNLSLLDSKFMSNKIEEPIIDNIKKIKDFFKNEKILNDYESHNNNFNLKYNSIQEKLSVSLKNDKEIHYEVNKIYYENDHLIKENNDLKHNIIELEENYEKLKNKIIKEKKGNYSFSINDIKNFYENFYIKNKNIILENNEVNNLLNKIQNENIKKDKQILYYKNLLKNINIKNNLKEYFASKKISKFIKKYNNINKQKNKLKNLSQLQKIKIAIGKDYLNKILKNQSEKFEIINKIIN